MQKYFRAARANAGIQIAKICRMIWIDPDVMARAVPFFAYMAALAMTDLAGRSIGAGWDLRWLYAVKTILVAGLLVVFRSRYRELGYWREIPVRDLAIAIVLGAAVFAAWINLDADWMVLGTRGGFNPQTQGRIDPVLVMARMVGATLVVPIIEELFWRSFLLRWLADRNFMQLDPARVSLAAFLAVAVLFGFEHDLWLAGMVAAVVYNYVYIATKNCWLPIISHAVTNGMLGIWVVGTDHWEFW